MVACSILGCKSNTLQKIENITFFRYPNEENIRQCWIKSTGRLDWQSTKNTRVCSLHFEPHCFRKTQMRVFLVDGSIPTIHVQKTIQPNMKNIQQLGQKNMDENPTTSTSTRAILNKAATSSGLPLINVGTQTMMPGYDVSSCGNCAAKSGGEGSSNKKRKLSCGSTETLYDTPRKKKLAKQLKEKTELAKLRQKKVVALRSKAWRLAKKTLNLKCVIENLKNNFYINQETADALTSIDPANKDILKKILGTVIITTFLSDFG